MYHSHSILLARLSTCSYQAVLPGWLGNTIFILVTICPIKSRFYFFKKKKIFILTFERKNYTFILKLFQPHLPNKMHTASGTWKVIAQLFDHVRTKQLLSQSQTLASSFTRTPDSKQAVGQLQLNFAPRIMKHSEVSTSLVTSFISQCHVY